MCSLQHPVRLLGISNHNVIPFNQQMSVRLFAKWRPGEAMHVQLLFGTRGGGVGVGAGVTADG